MSERNITDYLGYEYDKIPLWTTPKELMELWRKEYERGKAEGFIPVIIPIEDRLEDYLEDMEGQDYDVEQLPDVRQFFSAAKENCDDYSQFIGTMTQGDANDLMVCRQTSRGKQHFWCPSAAGTTAPRLTTWQQF